MTSYCNVLDYFHFSYRRLTFDAIVVFATTHQLLLCYASLNEISRTVQSGHMFSLVHTGSLLNTCQSTGHECIPSHSRWRNLWQDCNSCLTPKSTLVKSCQLVVPTAPLYIVPTWVKLPSSLVQPYKINTIHDSWPPLNDQLTTVEHMVHMPFGSIWKTYEHVWWLLSLPIPNNKFQTLKYYQVVVELLPFFQQLSWQCIVPTQFLKPQFMQEYLVWNYWWTNES